MVKTGIPGITISPVGGFGNQLFIYAAGFSAARRRGCPLYIDDSWFATQSLRSFELDTFASVGIMISKNSHKSFIPRSRQTRFARQLAIRLNLKSFKAISEDNPFSYNLKILSAPTGIRLSGYLQSYKYFEDVGEHIREQLFAVVNPSPWFHETCDSLNALGDWIAVHVRRGDYLNRGVREIHGILPASYYVQALQTMRRLIPEATPVIFSDDPDAARQMLSETYQSAIFIDSPSTSKSIESVILMSQSAGSIIANSSFSWWGAWLGEKKDRPVIAPRPWVNDANVQDRDLFPPSWLTLGRSL